VPAAATRPTLLPPLPPPPPQPTAESIDAVAADAGRALYQACHVNFAHVIRDGETAGRAGDPSDPVDRLAGAAVAAGGAARLAALHSHPLRFRCPGLSTVSLGMPGAVSRLLATGPGADAGLEIVVGGVVSGEQSRRPAPAPRRHRRAGPSGTASRPPPAFSTRPGPSANPPPRPAGLESLFLSIGQAPVIAAPVSFGPARAVAQQLAERLALPGFAASHGRFSGIRAAAGAGGPGGVGLGPRPLLVLVDRLQDVASGLAHPTTYAALVAETLPTSADGTRVMVPDASLPGSDAAAAAPASGRRGAFAMELDPESDSFWAHAADLPFGEAVELHCEGRQSRWRGTRPRGVAPAA